MLAVFRKLNKCLIHRPMITKIVISGGINCAGDIFAQYFDGLKEWDHNRTVRFATLMGFLIVPPQIIWYRNLQRVWHSNQHLRVAKRLAYDQFLFSPVYCAAVLIGLPIFEGFSINESISKMSNDWLDVYVHSLALWPAVQLINFYCIPLKYRVLLIQSVGLVWSAYLSMKTSHKTLL